MRKNTGARWWRADDISLNYRNVGVPCRAIERAARDIAGVDNLGAEGLRHGKQRSDHVWRLDLYNRPPLWNHIRHFSSLIWISDGSRCFAWDTPIETLSLHIRLPT